ncbi:MAG: hypothetical protein RL681_428 [Candidatus Parcubacteria bacterium]|jgi:drug/metabolite transporter (DMT)-like permease
MKDPFTARATLLALTTALISGFSNFLSKIAVTAVKDPILYTTLKNSIVAVLLVGIVLGLKRWPEIRALTKKQVVQLVAIGIIGGSVPFALFFTGLTMTSALNGALIHKTLFLWVALLALPILKERFTKWQWLGVGALFAANVVVGGFAGFKYNAGELMILAATLLWAVENVIAKMALKELSSTTVAAARMILGSFVLLALVSVRTGFAPIVALSAVQWGWTLLLSVFLLGYVLTWYAALKRAPATVVAALLVPATLVTNVLSAIFITHTFSGADFLQAGLFAAGIALIIVFAHKTTEQASPDSVSA